VSADRAPEDRRRGLDMPGVLPSRPAILPETDEEDDPGAPRTLVEAADLQAATDADAVLLRPPGPVAYDDVEAAAARRQVWVAVESPSEEDIMDLVASQARRLVVRLGADAGDAEALLALLEPSAVAVELAAGWDAHRHLLDGQDGLAVLCAEPTAPDAEGWLVYRPDGAGRWRLLEP